jgi:type 1 fimbria pilin
MKKKLIMWFVVMAALCSSGGSHAAACYQNVPNGIGFMKTPVVPNSFYISSTAPVGSILWKSDQITTTVFCRATSTPTSSIFYSVNPFQYSEQGVEVALILPSGIYRTGSRIDTGYTVDTEGSTFPLTYSLALIKTGISPSTGKVITDNVPFFTLLGTDNPPQNTLGTLVQYITATVNFSSGGTCSLAPGDSNKFVALHPIKPSAFPAVGSVAGQRPFTLTVNKCSSETHSAQFTFSGTQDADNPFAFANHGTAKGVAINLGSADDGSTIRANGTNNLKIVPVQNGSGVLNLFAQYIATAPVQAGSVNSLVTMDVTYQ